MKIIEYRLLQGASNEPHRLNIRKLRFYDLDGTEHNPWDEDDEVAQERLEKFIRERKCKIVERDGKRDLIVVEGAVKEGEILASRYGGMGGFATCDHRVEEDA